MRLLLVALCCIALTSCAWSPIMPRMPSDKEGAMVVRCREVKGWFGRDSHWLMIMWVWSKTGALPDNPGNIEIDSECQWRVEREPGPHVTLSPRRPGSAEEAHFKPHVEPPPK